MSREPTSILVSVDADDDPVDRATSVLAGMEVGELLAVLYDRSPDEWYRQAQDRIAADADDVRIVSVGASTRSVADGGRVAVDTTRRFVTPVPEPTDLTGLGIAVGEHLVEWGDDDGRPVVLVDSVTALLQWVDRDRAVQFLHVLSARIRRAGGVGVFLVTHTAHDEATRRMLTELFEMTVEPSSPPESSSDRRPSTETVMDLLADPRRRCVVRELLFDGETTVDRLADRIDEELGDGAGPRPAVRARLFHVDLPRLANAGIVAWDRDAEVVELAVPSGRVRPYLALMDADDA